MFFQQVFGILVSNCPAFYEHSRERHGGSHGGAFPDFTRTREGGQENKWNFLEDKDCPVRLF